MKEGFLSQSLKVSPGKVRFNLIDALRGVVILWIVAFHLLNEHRDVYPALLTRIITSGYLRVPLLFLVSGFAVSTLAAKVLAGKGSAFDFLKRRLIRIYKPLFFSLLTAGIVVPVLCAAVCYPFGLDSSEFFFHYSFWEWVGLFTLTKIFIPVAGDLNRAFLPINGALWFVAVVVQMYFVVFAALLKKQFYFPVLAAVTVLWSLTLIPGSDGWVPRGLFIGSWGPFAAGIVLYQVLNRGSQRLRWGLCAAALLLLSLSFSVLTFTVFAAVFLWAVYPYDGKVPAQPWFKPCAFLASFSYSLYLLHIPFDQLVSLIVEVMLIRLDGSKVPWHIIDPLVIIPAIMFLAWAWSLFFEKERTKKAD